MCGRAGFCGDSRTGSFGTGYTGEFVWKCIGSLGQLVVRSLKPDDYTLKAIAFIVSLLTLLSPMAHKVEVMFILFWRLRRSSWLAVLSKPQDVIYQVQLRQSRSHLGGTDRGLWYLQALSAG
jgi:hypothetical protein